MPALQRGARSTRRTTNLKRVVPRVPETRIEKREQSHGGWRVTEPRESCMPVRRPGSLGTNVQVGRGAAVITCKSEACRGSTGKSFTPLMRSTRSSTRFREWKGVFRAFRNFFVKRQNRGDEIGERNGLGRSVVFRGVFLETLTTFRRSYESNSSWKRERERERKVDERKTKKARERRGEKGR